MWLLSWGVSAEAPGFGKQDGAPGKKTKQGFTEPVWGQQAGGALTSQAREHQAASKGLPPLEFLSFTENQEKPSGREGGLRGSPFILQK